MPKSPDPSGNVAFIIYMHKDFLPVTFSPGLDLFGFHSQEPSRKVKGMMTGQGVVSNQMSYVRQRQTSAWSSKWIILLMRSKKIIFCLLKDFSN